MKRKKQAGITLIALVVTIVVLLILAGISINLVLGENGLISNAKEAREQTKAAEVNEKTQMDSSADWITETVADFPKTEETKPYMPSSEFIKVEGTSLENGLTIQDASGNQYVWVEVPITTEVYPTAGLNIKEFNDDAYKKIENDLHSYTNTYRNGTYYDDGWNEDTNNPSEWYTEEQYNEAKKKMLKSVYQNGGFWVGKYEAGIEKNRTTADESIIAVPQSKPDLYPYTYITRTQAKKLAEMVQYNNKYTGSLMFGVQWDLMLKFIENKKIESDNEIVTKLNVDSTSRGNYYNATYTINRGRYAVLKNGKLNIDWNKYNESIQDFVDGEGKKAELSNEDGILLTTGAVEKNSLMNIYDIAGNVYEWTLEYTLNKGVPCVNRGGSFNSNSLETPASYRNYGDYYNCGYHIGFRICLY